MAGPILMDNDSLTLLRLLQLASPVLPVGAYSYSEGLEALVQQGILKTATDLEQWLLQELQRGAIRLESAVMMRVYTAQLQRDEEGVCYWNNWLSAVRETEELRQQSWQMGRALLRLFQELGQSSVHPGQILPILISAWGDRCNFAAAFGSIAAIWDIPLEAAALGYVHSWAANLVGAGVRLIPLGQTSGQQILLDLAPVFSQVTGSIRNWDDDTLWSCGWGLALASMAHEVQYSRLFRS